jgi:putative endonuclease
MALHNDYGQEAEIAACQYLQSKGYRILERNWHWRKYEIDIIAIDKQEIVVVEVKARATDTFEQPENAVTRSQQKRIVEATEAYILLHEIDLPVRFDILGFLGREKKPVHIPAAFIPTI